MSRSAASLPEAAQAALWSDGPDAIVVGTILPAGEASLVDGGWMVQGQWRYVSGVGFCDWALLSCRVPLVDGEPEIRLLLAPRASFTIEHDWSSVGLRATASHTIRLPPTFIPLERSIPRALMFAGQPTADVDHSALRVPHAAISGLGFAAVVLGAARAGFGHWLDGKRAADPAGWVGAAAARADGLITAAEVLLHRTAVAADACTAPMDDLAQARAHRDHALAAEMVAAAMDLLWRSAGSAGSRADGAFARYWRDVQAAVVHPALNLDRDAPPLAALLFRGDARP